MRKIIFLVDAENIPFDMFKRYYAEVEPLKGMYEVIGRVYGSYNVLGKTVAMYCAKGFEFIETSSLSLNTKNVADMKMSVDCTDLVLRTYKQEVAYVYILSRDNDFLPVVYKMESLGIEVRTAIKDINRVGINKPKILKHLQLIGYLPISAENSVKCIYSELKSQLADEYENEDIVNFINTRFSLFIGAAANHSWNVAKIQRMRPEKVSFELVAQNMKMKKFSDLVDIYGMYTRRVFGSAVKRENIEPYLEKLWRDMHGSI